MNFSDAKIYSFLLGLRYKNDQVFDEEKMKKINELKLLV